MEHPLCPRPATPNDEGDDAEQEQHASDEVEPERRRRVARSDAAAETVARVDAGGGVGPVVPVVVVHASDHAADQTREDHEVRQQAGNASDDGTVPTRAFCASVRDRRWAR